MKRVFLILAIGLFAACNENATNAEKAVDSSANATIDSLKAESGSGTVDSGSNSTVDSSKVVKDSINN